MFIKILQNKNPTEIMNLFNTLKVKEFKHLLSQGLQANRKGSSQFSFRNPVIEDTFRYLSYLQKDYPCRDIRIIMKDLLQHIMQKT